ncbi:MAG: carboxymuconolactone decarboxylase family protein [Bacteroidales bacterium]
MSLIKLVEPEEATGKVAEIYQNMMNTMGFIPNAFKLYSPSEHALSQQVANLNFYFRHPKLGGKLLAFIRLLVSDQEKCEYCVGMNTQILFQYGVFPDMVNEIMKDHNQVPLEENEKAMLFFVLKVVKNSNSIIQEDVEKLRQLGWTDSEILEATYHGATQVAADMMLNAFKLDLDK